MGLPVGGVDGGILHGVSAVQHHIVTHIDPHMGYAGGFIGALEENQVSRFCFASGYRRADIVKPLCAKATGIHKSAVGQHIGDKAGAVKGGRGV